MNDLAIVALIFLAVGLGLAVGTLILTVGTRLLDDITEVIDAMEDDR